GGGGGGQGEAADGGDTGSGMGFGMTARPVGAYRIRDDDVEWVPAQDQTRVLIGAQVMVVIALVVIRSLVKMRRRPRTQE
ncbi:MAG: sporulation protein, partial [Acidimicrobiia bacterium]|nr:sporulation protein [Acidimicrobiia bacterium]